MQCAGVYERYDLVSYTRTHVPKTLEHACVQFYELYVCFLIARVHMHVHYMLVCVVCSCTKASVYACWHVPMFVCSYTSQCGATQCHAMQSSWRRHKYENVRYYIIHTWIALSWSIFFLTLCGGDVIFMTGVHGTWIGSHSVSETTCGGYSWGVDNGITINPS